MTMKLDLLDIDHQLTVSAIEERRCETWNCPTEILDLADEIEGRVDAYHFPGGVCGGCWKPTIKRLTTPTGIAPTDWFTMKIRLWLDDIELDLRKSFTAEIEKLRNQAAQLTNIASALECLNPVAEESEVEA